MTLPIECPDCSCGTVLNCACDWERVNSPIMISKEDIKNLYPKIIQIGEQKIIYPQEF